MNSFFREEFVMFRSFYVFQLFLRGIWKQYNDFAKSTNDGATRKGIKVKNQKSCFFWKMTSFFLNMYSGWVRWYSELQNEFYRLKYSIFFSCFSTFLVNFTHFENLRRPFSNLVCKKFFLVVGLFTFSQNKRQKKQKTMKNTRTLSNRINRRKMH